MTIIIVIYYKNDCYNYYDNNDNNYCNILQKWLL